MVLIVRTNESKATVDAIFKLYLLVGGKSNVCLGLSVFILSILV